VTETEHKTRRAVNQLSHLLMSYHTYDGRSVVSFTIGDANYYAILDAINLLKGTSSEKQPD
jgi:hypothetical protein